MFPLKCNLLSVTFGPETADDRRRQGHFYWPAYTYCRGPVSIQFSLAGVCNTAWRLAGGFTRAGQAMTSCRPQSNYSCTVTLHGGSVLLRPIRATPFILHHGYTESAAITLQPS